MSDLVFEGVDTYLNQAIVKAPPVLAEATKAAAKAGLPAIAVTPSQGKLLHILARAIGARRILEIGTLAGYSAIWLGFALPADGFLLTLEIDPDRAAVAEANLQRAGLSELVGVEVGPALDTLDRLITERAEPFDFVFIDADKENNLAYLERVLALVHPGSLIMVDNVVRKGSIARSRTQDPDVQASQELLNRLGNEAGLVATALQTVGSKGHDGFALAVVTG